MYRIFPIRLEGLRDVDDATKPIETYRRADLRDAAAETRGMNFQISSSTACPPTGVVPEPNLGRFLSYTPAISNTRP